MVVTCKSYHQLYCSTKLRIFQHIFLIIIYFRSSKHKSAPDAAKDVTAKVTYFAALGRLVFTHMMALDMLPH